MTTTDAPPGHAVSHQPSVTGTSRINALDGLRAFALLIIMSYHFGLRATQGGFFSLDIFYVLSGYLITGLLLGEYARRDSIRLGAFWLRRARRLLPALVVVVVVVTLYVRFVAVAGTYPEYRMSALSALFYFSNWWQIAASGNYFHATGPVYPLTHTWSLAVEEQFYLVWPLVVVATMALARTFARGVRALLWVSVLGAGASAVAMVVRYSATANITRLYFGTDTHAQSILIGAVLACVLTTIARGRGETGMAPEATRGRGVLTALGLAGFVVTLAITYVFTGTDAFCYRGGFTLSALAAAAIITAAITVPTGPIAKVLATAPLVFLGTVSYGAYLWHFPVFLWLDATRSHTHGAVLFVLRFGLTFALATASYFLIERPVMEGRFWRTARAAVPALAALAATVVVVVTLGSSALAGSAATEGLITPGAGARHAAMVRAYEISAYPPGNRGTRVLMEGDSLALTVSIGISPYAAQYGIDLGGRPHVGCGLATSFPVNVHGTVGTPFPDCPDWRTQWAADVHQLHPRVVGLIVGYWEAVDRVVDGRWQHLGQPGFDAYERAQLEQAVGVLSSDGARVVLFTSPYFSTGEQPDGRPWPQDDPARVQALNRIIASVAARDRRVAEVVPLNRFLDPEGHFTRTIGGQVVRQGDGVHTTVPGGRYLAPLVLPLLARVGR